MSINTSDIQSTDTIFTSSIGHNLFGGGDNLSDSTPSGNTGLPPNAKFASYELPLEIEDIGMPVYLSGIIQLITVVLLLSKQKVWPASIAFFTIGIYMFTVHCVFSGKADKLGQFSGLCRNFSYLMILFPLINVMLVLSSDYLKIWNHLRYNPGKLKIQLPHFQMSEDSGESHSHDYAVNHSHSHEGGHNEYEDEEKGKNESKQKK